MLRPGLKSRHTLPGAWCLFFGRIAGINLGKTRTPKKKLLLRVEAYSVAFRIEDNGNQTGRNSRFRHNDSTASGHDPVKHSLDAGAGIEVNQCANLGGLG